MSYISSSRIPVLYIKDITDAEECINTFGSRLHVTEYKEGYNDSHVLPASRPEWFFNVCALYTWLEASKYDDAISHMYNADWAAKYSLTSKWLCRSSQASQRLLFMERSHLSLVWQNICAYFKWKGEEIMFFNLQDKKKKKYWCNVFLKSYHANKIRSTGLCKSQQYCNIYNEGICKMLWIKNVCKCFYSYTLNLFSAVAAAHTPCIYTVVAKTLMHKQNKHANIFSSVTTYEHTQHGQKDLKAGVPTH